MDGAELRIVISDDPGQTQKTAAAPDTAVSQQATTVVQAAQQALQAATRAVGQAGARARRGAGQDDESPAEQARREMVEEGERKARALAVENARAMIDPEFRNQRVAEGVAKAEREKERQEKEAERQEKEAERKRAEEEREAERLLDEEAARQRALDRAVDRQEAEKEAARQKEEARRTEAEGARRQAVLGGIRGAGSAAQTAGDVAAGFAGGTGAAGVMGTVNAVAGAVGVLGPAGMAASAGIKAFTGAVGAAEKVVSSFADRGKELSQFSPGIAAAAAESEVRALFRDMREATRLDKEYSRILTGQARVQDRIAEMLMPIKENLAKFVAGALEFFEKVLVGANVSFELLKVIQATLGEMLAGVSSFSPKRVIAAIKEAPGKMEEAVRKGMQKALDDVNPAILRQQEELLITGGGFGSFGMGPTGGPPQIPVVLGGGF